MRRVLFVSSGHALDDDRVTRKEAISLFNCGYDVYVCARKRMNYVDSRVKLIDVSTLAEVEKGGETNYRPVSRFQRLKTLMNLYRANDVFRPDLIVAHEFETACLAWWIKKRYGTPYVFDSHEGFENTVPLALPWVIRWAAFPVVRFMLRRIARASAGITAASAGIYVYQYAKRIGKPAELIYNSAPLEYFPYAESAAEPVTIVHEGNLTKDRGAFEMLDALAIVAQTRKFRFLVLGTISKDIEGAFLEKIKNLGLQEQVDVRGRLPWDEFGQIEKEGMIGLICFQKTYNCKIGMPNKLFDYMSCGLAVLALKGSLSGDFVEREKCGIAVDTTNPSAIAGGLTKLIDDRDGLLAMARNGRKAIEEKYGWPCMEKTMLKFYGFLGI